MGATVDYRSTLRSKDFGGWMGEVERDSMMVGKGWKGLGFFEKLFRIFGVAGGLTARNTQTTHRVRSPATFPSSIESIVRRKSWMKRKQNSRCANHHGLFTAEFTVDGLLKAKTFLGECIPWTHSSWI